MENEVWKDIPGFNGKYIASDMGRIRNTKTGNYLSSKGDKNGYLRACLDGKTFKAHRLILMTFDPIRNNEEMQVNHRNGKKFSNELNNLEWCDGNYNIRHAIENGLRGEVKRGTESSTAKLTKSDLTLIFDMLMEQMDYLEISETLNIRSGIVGDLMCARSYIDEFSEYRSEILKKKRKIAKIKKDEMALSKEILSGKFASDKDIDNIKTDYFKNGLNFDEICSKYKIGKVFFAKVISEVPNNSSLRLQRKFSSSSHQAGAKNGRAKLTPEKVLEIIDLCNKGELATEKIGSMYGIAGASVRSIRSGKSWASVTGIDYTKRNKDKQACSRGKTFK
tara:strand:+ start:159 stop:1163 length:1005 start_codon:yes stop_codon:yes gene_type:complete